ncbi:MAG: hypothetical protein MZV49_16935 [Rhodopseudomonas palustris]|nr:hypothetical protein [Rhodopseudomonas palustris]
MALALVMIYQATHHINFAQGEMATFSHLHRLGADPVGRAVLGRVRRSPSAVSFAGGAGDRAASCCGRSRTPRC